MTAQAVIPQAPSGKVETKPTSSPKAPQQAVPEARPSVYWGDRFTIRFWLFCFALMTAMNLVDAVHRFVLYVLGTPLSP
jgi:hypothetical protein